MPASSTRLRLSFGLGFLTFIVLGSLLLLTWLRQRELEESNRLFHALAQADAEFVRRMNLPRSEKLAGDLEQLLGMQIEFREVGKGVVKDDDTLVVRLDDKNDMVFTRKPVALQLSLRDPATRNAFIAFWLVSGLVGWLLARERLKRAQSERLAMLGRVATSLAHDIKNPLASIQLHAQLMTPRDGEDAKALKMIESESEVIAGLVNQWLHLANPLPPKLVKLDVVECVTAVVQKLEAQARHTVVDIENGLLGPIWVMGDAQRLSQAFRNLIVNAIQAMPRGGKLRITAYGQPLTQPLPEVDRDAKETHRRGEGNRFVDTSTRIPSPRPTAAPKGKEHFGERSGEGSSKNFITIRFADSGLGFSAAALARGTELFFTEKEGGMGVGLNIVASIVAAHGGRLELQNDPKGGAVILVSLPSLAA